MEKNVVRVMRYRGNGIKLWTGAIIHVYHNKHHWNVSTLHLIRVVPKDVKHILNVQLNGVLEVLFYTMFLLIDIQKMLIKKLKETSVPIYPHTTE